MNTYLQDIHNTPCSCCGSPIGPVHVNLSRQQEQDLDDETACTTVTNVIDSQVLASYCLECGLDAAYRDLAELGLAPNLARVHTELASCQCAHCRVGSVEANEWHSTYSVTVDEFGGGCFRTINEPLVAVVCAECDWKITQSPEFQSVFSI